jgi:hypothetical protein
MSGQKRPSTSLRDHKKSCIRAIFNNCYCGIEQTYPSWRGIRHGSTAASGLRARVPEAAAPGAPEFEYEQGMQANLNEGFQGGDDAGTETAHALFTRCACTHPCTRAHTCTHPCTRTHTHARKPVCTDAHTNTHVRALRYMHAHLHTCSTHTYTHA